MELFMFPVSALIEFPGCTCSQPCKPSTVVDGKRNLVVTNNSPNYAVELEAKQQRGITISADRCTHGIGCTWLNKNDRGGGGVVFINSGGDRESRRCPIYPPASSGQPSSSRQPYFTRSSSGCLPVRLSRLSQFLADILYIYHTASAKPQYSSTVVV